MLSTLSNHTNSVTLLRQRELARSRREFLARGSRVKRCTDCMLAKSLCMCSLRPAPSGAVAVCLVYYHGEVFKPSNTGRLVADVLADNHAFLWHRTEPDPAMLALVQRQDYAPLVIFPYNYAAPERHMKDDETLQRYLAGRKPLLIFLDGTWREARKMFRSSWLANYPVIAIEPTQASNYRLREAFHEHQLGTAEVAIDILQRLGEHQCADNLSTYFELFKDRYLAGRANHFSMDEAVE